MAAPTSVGAHPVREQAAPTGAAATVARKVGSCNNAIEGEPVRLPLRCFLAVGAGTPATGTCRPAQCFGHRIGSSDGGETWCRGTLRDASTRHRQDLHAAFARNRWSLAHSKFNTAKKEGPVSRAFRVSPVRSPTSCIWR